jgi:hypothetical protein
MDRGVGRCPESREEQENLVLFDQLARHLHSLGRRVTIIVADEVDLAAVDTTGLVDHLEEGLVRPAD